MGIIGRIWLVGRLICFKKRNKTFFIEVWRAVLFGWGGKQGACVFLLYRPAVPLAGGWIEGSTGTRRHIHTFIPTHTHTLPYRQHLPINDDRTHMQTHLLALDVCCVATVWPSVASVYRSERATETILSRLFDRNCQVGWFDFQPTWAKKNKGIIIDWYVRMSGRSPPYVCHISDGSKSLCKLVGHRKDTGVCGPASHSREGFDCWLRKTSRRRWWMVRQHATPNW